MVADNQPATLGAVERAILARFDEIRRDLPTYGLRLKLSWMQHLESLPMPPIEFRALEALLVDGGVKPTTEDVERALTSAKPAWYASDTWGREVALGQAWHCKMDNGQTWRFRGALTMQGRLVITISYGFGDGGDWHHIGAWTRTEAWKWPEP